MFTTTCGDPTPADTTPAPAPPRPASTVNARRVDTPPTVTATSYAPPFRNNPAGTTESDDDPDTGHTCVVVPASNTANTAPTPHPGAPTSTDTPPARITAPNHHPDPQTDPTPTPPTPHHPPPTPPPATPTATPPTPPHPPPTAPPPPDPPTPPTPPPPTPPPPTNTPPAAHHPGRGRRSPQLPTAAVEVEAVAGDAGGVLTRDGHQAARPRRCTSPGCPRSEVVEDLGILVSRNEANWFRGKISSRAHDALPSTGERELGRPRPGRASRRRCQRPSRGSRRLG